MNSFITIEARSRSRDVTLRSRHPDSQLPIVIYCASYSQSIIVLCSKQQQTTWWPWGKTRRCTLLLLWRFS